MEKYGYRVVITDCDHGSIEEEKEEFGRIGAELMLAQVKEEEDVIRVLQRGRWNPEPVCALDSEGP